jgi:hypothetical protein
MKKNKSLPVQPTAEMLPNVNVNGKEIVMTYADGRWWIAVKPICEVLNVEYTRQFKNLKEHRIFSRALAIQPTHDSSKRKQEMLCISEKYIYGWLSNIQSDSPELLSFQEECYEVLYNYFHGGQSKRNLVLKETTLIDREIEEVEKELQESPIAQKLNKLRAKKQLGIKTLKLLDKEIIGKQYSLWEKEAIADANASTSV